MLHTSIITYNPANKFETKITDTYAWQRHSSRAKPDTIQGPRAGTALVIAFLPSVQLPLWALINTEGQSGRGVVGASPTALRLLVCGEPPPKAVSG